MAGAVNNDEILKLRISGELLDRVRTAAGGEGRVSEFTRQALEEKLARRGGTPGPGLRPTPRL